jgi:FdrA protein
MALNNLFTQELKVINMGLESFHDELKSQHVQTVQVAWKPRAGGSQKMLSLLNKLKKVSSSKEKAG